jgi:hypothetical protein
MAASMLSVLLFALALPSTSGAWTQSTAVSIASTSSGGAITGAGSASGAGNYIYLSSGNCAPALLIRPALALC